MTEIVKFLEAIEELSTMEDHEWPLEFFPGTEDNRAWHRVSSIRELVDFAYSLKDHPSVLFDVESYNRVDFIKCKKSEFVYTLTDKLTIDQPRFSFEVNLKTSKIKINHDCANASKDLIFGEKWWNVTRIKFANKK